MKTLFSRSSRRAATRGATLTPTMLVVGGGVALVLLIGLILRLAAPEALVRITAPAFAASTRLAAAVDTATTVSYRATLTARVAALTSENEALRAENAVVSARAADLAHLLGTRTERGAGILAGVLARPPVSPYDTLVIDAGLTEGIHMSARVYGAGGIPVGTVESVDTHIARVTLFSTAGLQTQGWVGETRVPLQLTGASAGAFDATLSKETPVMVGDKVYVSGPGALPIGVVESIESDPSSPTDTLHVRPFINPFTITWVTVDPT